MVLGTSHTTSTSRTDPGDAERQSETLPRHNRSSSPLAGRWATGPPRIYRRGPHRVSPGAPSPGVTNEPLHGVEVRVAADHGKPVLAGEGGDPNVVLGNRRPCRSQLVADGRAVGGRRDVDRQHD